MWIATDAGVVRVDPTGGAELLACVEGPAERDVRARHRLLNTGEGEDEVRQLEPTAG